METLLFKNKMDRTNNNRCREAVASPTRKLQYKTLDHTVSGAQQPHTGLWFSGWSRHWGKGSCPSSWQWLLCAEKAGSKLKAVFAQGYLVLNVVSTGAHSSPGRVWSNTAEEQAVRLEHTVFVSVVIGWEHQVTARTLCCSAINAIAEGKQKKKSYH